MKQDNRYLSDEELFQLIAEVEEEPLLEAPVYLKDKILSQAREEKRLKSVKQKMSARKQLVRYGCKVALASAAAVAILFTTPMNIRVTEEKVEKYSRESILKENAYAKSFRSSDGISSKITDKSNQICDQFERITNLLIGKEELRNEKAEEK